MLCHTPSYYIPHLSIPVLRPSGNLLHQGVALVRQGFATHHALPTSAH